ncbi:MAG TPA: hypothetical protein VIJ75_06015 [Hanamia sp.]
MKRNDQQKSDTFNKPMMTTFLNGLIFALPLCFFFGIANAQDTTHRQTIEITSAYKPSLLNTVKINLYASPVTSDTSRPRLNYSIPSESLFYTYKANALSPLALDIDTSLDLGGRNQLKVGFGNNTTPFVSGAFSFGDGKHSLGNIYGNYISSRGKIQYQDFNELNLKGTGSLFTEKNEVYAGMGFALHQYYQYGYNHAINTFSKSDISRGYQDFSVNIGYRNIVPNDLGINYNPHIEVHQFARGSKAGETNLIMNLPAEKRFSDKVSFKVALLGNFNHYKIKGDTVSFSNNLFQLVPEFTYYGDRFTMHAGISPTWNNGALAILPNIYGEAKLSQSILSIQAGVVGTYIANSFRSLSEENPYMSDPTFLKNTKEMQYYGGIKATLGNHFNFSAKAAYISYTDMPLFVNDTLAGNTFVVSNESKINNFQIHGDLNFVSQDKFTVTGAVDLNSYTGLRDNAEAWGLFPLKLTGSLRWNAFEHVLIKADLAAFSGASARTKTGAVSNQGGSDLSAGAEYQVTKKIGVWLDFDNLFNNKYQRWYNYPVYGFQVIGGVLIHF